MKGGDGVRGFRSVTNDADAWLDLAWAPTAAELSGLPRGAFRAIRFAHYEGDTAAGRAGAPRARRRWRARRRRPAPPRRRRRGDRAAGAARRCGGAAPNAARAEAELIAGLGGAEGVWRAALRHAGVARAAEAELLEIIAEESAGLAPSAAVCAQWRGADRSSLERLNGDDFMAVTVGDDEVAVRDGAAAAAEPAA